MGISARSTQLPSGTTQICTAKCDSRSSHTNGTKDAASSALIPSSDSLGKAPDVPDLWLDAVLEEREMAGRGQSSNPAESRRGAHGLKMWLHRAFTPVFPIPGMAKGSL